MHTRPPFNFLCNAHRPFLKKQRVLHALSAMDQVSMRAASAPEWAGAGTGA
jgi:hypothetical protein